MLPLLLGLIGLFYQLGKDKHNWWVTMLLFLLTGIAIAVYLNMPPYQPRERDYAFAGSYYAFAIWIGLAVMAIHDLLKRWVPAKVSAIAVSSVCLIVPIQMASQTWDDHDRSDRFTARDLAYNYLNSTEKNSILVTHGDNDTFPLWYIQEVEGVRTDVRIMNTSLLGTDWYIDQMKFRTYDSDPVPFTVPKRNYLYGTNDIIWIYDKLNKPLPLKLVVDLVSNPDAKVRLSDGELYNFFAARQLTIPVDKEKAIANGIVSVADSAQIVDTIVLNLPENKDMMTKAELMILDMLANYKWDRPIYFVAMGGDLEIGIRDYLEYTGFAYKFVPIKSKTSLGYPGRVPAEKMYDKVMNVYKWGNMNDPKVNIDYQNLLTFTAVTCVRNIFTQTARALVLEGKADKAIAVLDKMQAVMIPSQFPLNISLLGSLNEHSVLEAIDIYILAGAREKGLSLADAFTKDSFTSIDLFAQKYNGFYLSKSDIERSLSYLVMLADVLKNRGENDKAADIEKQVNETIKAIQAI